MHRYTLPALDLLLFAYLLWFRTHGLSETFWLYGDQVRDWTIALKGFSELPLVGPPSLAGGNTAGPIYYWLLWLFARVIGPWCDYLPHAGGIGISLLASIADASLFHALALRLRFTALALAIVVIVATSGTDATVTGTIWNPPVAIALMKAAIAIALVVDIRSHLWLALIAAILWLGVQAHTTVLPVVISVFLWMIASSPGWRAAASRAAVVAFVVAVLQAPWAVDRAAAGVSADTPLGQSILAAARDPIHAVRPIESATALLRAVGANLRVPMPLSVTAAVLIVGATALVAMIRDSLIATMGIAPLICTIVLFAIWQGPLTENYWYLPIALSAVLCIMGWMAALSGIVRTALVASVLALTLMVQPAQAQYTWTTLRTPVYGALVRASRSLKQSRVPVRDITTTFAMPPGTSPSYLYGILGGRLDPSAPQRAIFGPAGQLLFEAVDRLAPRQ